MKSTLILKTGESEPVSTSERPALVSQPSLVVSPLHYVDKLQTWAWLTFFTVSLHESRTLLTMNILVEIHEYISNDYDILAVLATLSP